MYNIEPITPKNRELATEFIARKWHTTQIVVRGETVDCTQIDGFIALDAAKENVIGQTVYIFRGDACEIVLLNSEQKCAGLGSALIEKVKGAALAHSSKILRLVTTNDNLNAIGFYQKRGFELVGLNLGAFDRLRESIPQIPLIGDNGIPLHHEIHFAMDLNK
ncbi:MAG: GNAT family N-acetyltransferase [Sporomusaceae bacterium]|nr:GNAT family N-acetyltransferase [Sporomusaceae bacterium]